MSCLLHGEAEPSRLTENRAPRHLVLEATSFRRNSGFAKKWWIFWMISCNRVSVRWWGKMRRRIVQSRPKNTLWAAISGWPEIVVRESRVFKILASQPLLPPHLRIGRDREFSRELSTAFAQRRSKLWPRIAKSSLKATLLLTI